MKNPKMTAWEAQEDGYLVFDSQFNPAPKLSQQRMSHFCDELHK
jgi:hypothetical protein